MTCSTSTTATIDYQELLIGLSLLCSDSPEELAELVFKMFDVGETGRITKMGVEIILKTSLRLHGNAVAIATVERKMGEIFGEKSTRDLGEAGYTQKAFVKVLEAHPELVGCVIDEESQRRLGRNFNHRSRERECTPNG